MEIRIPKRESQHIGCVDKPTRDALAAHVRHRWPVHSAKCAAREWGLSLDEARGVVAGRTSLATLDRIFKHPNGGWAVILPVMGSVVGHSVEDFFNSETQRLRDERRQNEARIGRAMAAVRNLRSRPALADHSAHRDRR